MNLIRIVRWLLIAFAVVLLSNCVGANEVDSDSRPVSHSQWSALLKKHVNAFGLVDYRGFAADSLALNAYLTLLSNNHPNAEHWTESEQIAYWINAYNAFTIRLIIRHYPVKSIKDIAGRIPFINSAWDLKFIEIEGHKYDLNNIEHGILRTQFYEPRIHFALVCAAMSCPKLRNEAYTANKLDEQLQADAQTFFNDPTKNTIGTHVLELSKILDWYGGDFERAAVSMQEYVNKFTSVEVSPKAEIKYRDYNWALNEQP